jgi:cyclic dehypoxanthinyl futalosine synthase
MGISREQALDCFASDDLIGIGMEADAVRRRLHPEGVVTYGMSRVIDCAGRTAEAIYAEVEAAEEMGATGIVLAGGYAAVSGLIAGVRQRFPELWLQGLSAREVADAGIHVAEAIGRLRAAGLDTIGGATPEKPNEAWVAVHRAAHQAGMRTTARVVFGAGETFAERLDGFDAIRMLQAETGAFDAIAPVSFHAQGGRELDETTAVEYLKTLAVARIYLESIENVEADWTTQGLKVLQMGLRFGANDVGAVQVERTKGATEEELRRVIRDAGFRPAQRELGYRAMLVG